MTLEEAVERILVGRAFFECEACSGSGVRIHATCEECGGEGSYLDLTYADACKVLNQPVPRNIKGFWQKAFVDISSQKLQKDITHMTEETMKDLGLWNLFQQPIVKTSDDR